MQSQDPKTHDPRRAEDPQRREPQRQADATRKERTRFVDPYDMRAEPQLEEPGYGHGV